MGLFGFGSKAPKKPKGTYIFDAGIRKVTVYGTNQYQDNLKKLNVGLNVTLSVTELSPEQIESGRPAPQCLNVCRRRSKVATQENILGYIDPDKQDLKQLKSLVKEYSVVEIHGRSQGKDGKVRLMLLVP